MSPVTAAFWAIQQSGQNDPATIDALISRLSFPNDPLWLTGDVIGALSAVTDKRFAYDIAAWQDWWQSCAPEWIVSDP